MNQGRFEHPSPLPQGFGVEGYNRDLRGGDLVAVQLRLVVLWP